MLKNLLITSLVFLYAIPAISNQGYTNYSPPISFHEIPNIKENLAVWQISFYSDNRLVCATDKGLYEFDGLRWELHPECKYLRTVITDKNNITYSGGIKSIGYWSIENSFYTYHSLLNKVKKDFTEIWEIIINDKLIYYQSYENIFVYNTENGEMNTIEAPYQFINLFEANDRIFIIDSHRGLMEIIDNKPVEIDYAKSIACEIEQVVYSERLSQLVLATHHKIYRLDEQQKQLLPIDIGFKTKVHIQTITALNQNRFAINTITNGIYIIDCVGTIHLHIHKGNGLLKQTAFTQNIDQYGHLWIGNHNGLTQINLTSPLLYNSDNTIQEFRVNDMLQIAKTTYIATDKGLYKSVNKSTYELIPELSGLTMFVDSIKGEILVGMHKGAWAINKDGEVRKLSNEIGAWNFTQPFQNPDIMVGGTYRGLIIYNFINNKWVEFKILKDFNTSSRFVYSDKHNIIWVAHPNEGYYKLNIDYKKGVINEVTHFNSGNSPFTPPYLISKYKNNILFHNNHSYFNFNLANSTFIANKELNKVLGNKLTVYKLVEINNKLWITEQGAYWVYDKTLKRLPQISHPILGDFSNINRIDHSQVGIGLLKSYAIYNSEIDTAKYRHIIPKLKQAVFFSSKGKEKHFNNKVKVNYKYSTLRLDYYFPNTLIGQYSDLEYRLNGVDSKWVVMNKNLSVIYNSLPAGKYTFELRNMESKQKFETFHFKIHPPWFLSWWGLSLIILLITSITLVISGYITRIKELKKINYIHQEEKKRAEQQKEHEHQQLLNEKKIRKIEEEKLLNEVSQQRNELMSSVLAHAKKNELILEIKEKIEGITPGNTTNKKILSRLMRKINSEIDNKEEWVTFELRFKSANKKFYDTITKKHTNLTPNEFRLCVYIKLKINNKEIASLMNISAKSVEMARYRLRKKLALENGVSINEYITQMGNEANESGTTTQEDNRDTP